MAIILTVVSAFGDYPRGAQITDASMVAEILDSDQAEKVVRTSAPDVEPEPHPQSVAAVPAAASDETPAHTAA